MPNYYEVLKVSPKASRSEIKSAYRRLARKLHPDRNNGSEETALKFAAIAEAYEVLGSTKERAKYDQTILNAQFSTNGDSVFTSENPHARRWRRMVYEKRYNDIIDRMIAEERRETMAFQRAVYPAVSLLFTAFLAAALKPKIFITTGVLGKIVIISLFVAGLIHLGKRLRDAFVKYTDDDAAIHESILDGEERPPRQVSRVVAAGGLIVAVIAALGLGHLVGMRFDTMGEIQPAMFSTSFEPEFFLYPPIVTLLVDALHSFVSRGDG
jgi:hypothetical protein